MTKSESPSAKQQAGTSKKKAERSSSTENAVSAIALRDDDQLFAKLVSLANLRKTWNAVRKEAKLHIARDAVDCLDWAVSIDATLPQLCEQLLSGDYTPSPPSRYELAKSKGSYRIITVPNIRNVLVYRLICDEALRLGMPSKVKGAFFSRRHKATPVGNTFDLKDDPYLRFFNIWLKYQEYRTKTLLNQPYEVLVVSDITNYFDSISIELLMEYLAPLGLPRKAVGLLGRILEALKPPAGHSPNPRIGIPADEFDCSRELSHVFLFEHDRRMVSLFGEDNYVRWMDDQNVGAQSFTEARKIVNKLTNSLSSQRLTLNSGKTLFLTPEDVELHFQLEANELLSEWESKYWGKLPKRADSARMELGAIWEKISNGPSAEKGNWDKIIKRVYGLAAMVGSGLLDHRMYDDLIAHPHLDKRIFESLARRNCGEALLRLFERYLQDGESLFEGTEAVFFEACLLLDADKDIEDRIVQLAGKFVRGNAFGQSGGSFGKASAFLCLYWFGFRGSDLVNLFTRIEGPLLSPALARTWLACVTALDPKELQNVQMRLVGHPSDDVSKLSQFLADLLAGTIDRVGNYKNQKPRWPAPGKFYDVRAWLQLDLITQAKSETLLSTAKTDIKAFQKITRTKQEKRAFSRISARLA